MTGSAFAGPGGDELRYQRAVAACAHALLSRDASQHIGEALQAILEASGATSLFVAENVEDPVQGLCSRLVHEAVRPGDHVDNADWRFVPWSRLPESGAALARGELFVFVAGSFRSVEAQMRAPTGVKSGAQHPILVGDRWAGLVGFVDRERERSWSDHEIRLLAAAADLLARLWERQQHESELELAAAEAEKRYRYEQALAACSQALLSGTDDTALGLALSALLKSTSARYCTIERNVDHPDLGLCSELVCSAEALGGGQGHKPELDEFWALRPWSDMPDTYARLSKGVPFAFRISDLGPVESALYADSPTPVGAEVDIPIMVEGEWRGRVAFGYFDEDHGFDDLDTGLFQTAAAMVAAFWLRQEAQGQLEELLRSKDEFVAAVSHELRTPLTTVVGLAEELRDRTSDFSDGERVELHALIAEQAMEMANIVDDLLVAGRGDMGTIELNPIVVDVCAEVARSVASARADRPIVINAMEQLAATADAMRMRQILRNLITNALRYGGPEVRLDCGMQGASAVIRVSDDGPEIDEESRLRIFEPYQRAHDEPTQPASVGLGLTVSRRLARLMGGDLVYFRRAGRNVFELALPAAAPR